MTPWQILTTGLSRGSHTSPLPLCPKIPTAPAEVVAKYQEFSTGQGLEQQIQLSCAPHSNLELKVSPKAPLLQH